MSLASSAPFVGWLSTGGKYTAKVFDALPVSAFHQMSSNIGSYVGTTFDFAKRIRLKVDNSTLGMNFGNISFGLVPNKVLIPTVKGIGKVADIVPGHVPKNWSKANIEDAISTYEHSIRIRKAEAAAFDATGGGHLWTRKAHYERIVEEENFLRQLKRRLEEMR